MTALAYLRANYHMAANGCWHWTQSLNHGGYGQFRHDGVRTGAHRAAYELLVGPIPDGYDVDHTCHNRDTSCSGGPTCKHRRCINPDHLEAVTRSENLSRGEVGQWNRATTTCPQGHPYDDANTFNDNRGWRGCRECRREASRRHKAKKRNAV